MAVVTLAAMKSGWPDSPMWVSGAPWCYSTSLQAASESVWCAERTLGLSWRSKCYSTSLQMHRSLFEVASHLALRASAKRLAPARTPLTGNS